MNIPSFKTLKRRSIKLRLLATRHENILAERLRKRGIRFKFQRVIQPYIVDFLIVGTKTILEVDGKSHDGRQEYDRKRDAWLSGKGYKTIRIKNRDVWRVDLSRIREGIVGRAKNKAEDVEKPPSSMRKGARYRFVPIRGARRYSRGNDPRLLSPEFKDGKKIEYVPLTSLLVKRGVKK